MLLRHWLAASVALVVAGLIWSSGALVGLGVFIGIAGTLARIWADKSLDNVRLERRLPESRAFPGGRLRLHYRVSNRKLLPLASLEVREQLPEALAPPELQLRPSGVPGVHEYTKTTHLGWFERAGWTVDLLCTRRGRYRIGPARLRSGDAFGLFSKQRTETDAETVVVYPETRPLPDLGLPAARPLGERTGRERLLEDPLRIAGIRDYQPGDAIRRIDWKATARRGELQSRVYEPSSTHHLFLALNVDTLEHTWLGFLPDVLEANIVVAASIARWATEQRYAVGLLANGNVAESDQPITIAPGRGPDQLSTILESLAGINPMTLVPLAAMLERQSHSLPFGATLVVVTVLMPQALAAVLRRLHGSGQQVVVLSMSSETWPKLLGDVPVRIVSAVPRREEPE